MICCCFLTLRGGIPCNIAHRRRCVVELHDPGERDIMFFEFLVQLADGQNVVMSGEKTYDFLSGLYKNRARGDGPSRGVTAKMRDAKIHLAHLDNLHTSYKQGAQPHQDALDWWRDILMNVHLLCRINASEQMMTKYYEEHLSHMTYNIQERKSSAPQTEITWSDFMSSSHALSRASSRASLQAPTHASSHALSQASSRDAAEMSALREQITALNEELLMVRDFSQKLLEISEVQKEMALHKQLTQLREVATVKEKSFEEYREISHSRYEKLQNEHNALVRQEQQRKHDAATLNERLLMVRDCYQKYVNMLDVQKKIIEIAHIQPDPAIFLKNMLKIYDLVRTLETTVNAYKDAYDVIENMISPDPFICHMCENDSARARTNTSTQAICKQININGICMFCYYYRRYRAMPEPNYTVTPQKMPNIVVMALYDGFRGVYTCEEKVFEDLNRKLIQQVTSSSLCIQSIYSSVINSIGLMNSCVSIDTTLLKSCYEAELKLLAEDVKEDDKKETCSICCRERFDDDPETLVKHSPFVVPCGKCPMLKCCIECFSALELKRATRNDAKVMEQLNEDRKERHMGALSFVDPKTVSPCLNTPENCSVAKRWMNYFGLIGGINIVEMQTSPINLETVYDERGNIVFQGMLRVFDSDDE